jgi:aspartyl protease family protein
VLTTRHVLRLLLIVAVVAGIVAAAISVSTGSVTGTEAMDAVPLVVMVIWVVVRLAASTRPLGAIAGQLSLIIAFGVVLVAGYAYRSDFRGLTDRLMGAIVPSRGVEIAPGVLRFAADDRGQFAIDAMADGVTIHFMMDTGASGIVLSKRDAERIGFDLKSLTYSQEFSTANGPVRAAPVTLNSLQLGTFDARRVSAWVNEGDLDRSLLGMSFLSTLGRIEIKGDSLILEQAR